MVDVAKVTVRYEGDLTDLEAANRKAQTIVKDTANSMAKSTDKMGKDTSSVVGKIKKLLLTDLTGSFKKTGDAASSLTDKAIKVFAVLGAIEGGLKLADAAAKLFTGDLQGATEALKTMPFGIGPAIGALEGFLKTVTGINKALEESQKRLQGLTVEGQRLDKAAALLKKIVSERERLGKSPEEISAINIREETEQRVKALRDLGRTEREIALARELGAKKLLDIERTQRNECAQAMASASEGRVVATSVSGFRSQRALDEPRILAALERIVLSTQTTARKEELV